MITNCDADNQSDLDAFDDRKILLAPPRHANKDFAEPPLSLGA